ncbi:MAG: hypothetical protein JW895_03935 [Thermoleophilaceae bacterium]|nr:hypothetical protein [Thermoleophilaceae bacterium]
MDPRRLRLGEVLLAASGVALLVALFLPWYGPDLTGWEALGVVDVILALVAACAISVTLATAFFRVAAVPIALDALVTLFGLVALLLMLFRVLDVPGEASGREAGLWVALAAAAGVVVSGCLAMRDERLAAPGRYNDATGRPVPKPPDPEPLRAPPPGTTS